VTARFCLRCGARLVSVRDGEHRRRCCPRCGWTFYGNPVPACAAVVLAGGRLLLARRARPPYAGMWDLPGGFLEAGEEPLGALRRELREEIDLGVRRARLIGFTTDQYGRGGVAVLAAVYRVTPTSNRVRPADDVSEARWFRRTEIPYRRIAFPGVRRMLRRYLERSR
jgi:8-oxo-dGTP diphosphatase